jgi:hypothetical protein
VDHKIEMARFAARATWRRVRHRRVSAQSPLKRHLTQNGQNFHQIGDIQMTRLTPALCAAAALLALTTPTNPARADGRDWNDGPVVNAAYIRTVDGHFDEYMHWLATTYKQQEEAAKAAGLITNWRVLVVEARNPQDPDIILVTEFKNWAALDHLGGKLDQVSAKVEGSVEAAAKSEAERAKIRTVLGSRTSQEAILK